MKIQMSAEQSKLYNEMKRLAKRTNQRLLRLERYYGKDVSGKQIYNQGQQYLKERLSIEPLKAWSKKGRVRASKKFNETQMMSIISTLRKFNRSLYSTKTGIKKIRKKGVENLRQLLDIDPDVKITSTEAEALYRIFEDREVNRITQYIKGSDLTPLIEEAREKQSDYEVFRQNALSIINSEKGKYTENLLKKVYLKYVYKGNRSKSLDIETTNKYIIDLINNAKYSADLDEIQEILNLQSDEFKINNREYNYLLNLIKEKRNEILDGV